ncbi:MAG: hypothetical protein U0T79_09430 [Ferruginibacter sp.]
MTLKDLIEIIDTVDEDMIVYAKRIEGNFKTTSDAVILDLTDEERSMPTKTISEIKCPGFDYFLEVFLIKEVLEDYTSSSDLLIKTERVIYYAEFDA